MEYIDLVVYVISVLFVVFDNSRCYKVDQIYNTIFIFLIIPHSVTRDHFGSFTFHVFLVWTIRAGTDKLSTSSKKNLIHKLLKLYVMDSKQTAL